MGQPAAPRNFDFASRPVKSRRGEARAVRGLLGAVALVLRLPASVVFIFALALGGCGDPQGIVRVHFSMTPPNVIDFGADAGAPPVELFDLSRASGTLDVFADIHHLTSEYSGVPTPTDPEQEYLLWLSASDRGGDWTLGGELTLQPSGAAAVHLDQADVPMDFLTVRAAVLTLDFHEATEPSPAVVLTGAVGRDEETAAAPAGTGAHVHEH